MPSANGPALSSSPTAGNPALSLGIRELAPGDDPSAFRTLNEEWISRYFTLEAKDREQLGDPENSILRLGGRIFIARYNGEDVGCVAIVPKEEKCYELSKMAVKPECRGLGIGRALLLHAIGQARSAGASSLFLGSNSRLKAAISLYESAGFRHVPADRLPPMHYTRANVFMELLL